MMSAKTYSKQKKKLSLPQGMGRRLFFCHVQFQMCASSAMPTSRFLKRVTLKGISQSCTISRLHKKFSCPK